MVPETHVRYVTCQRCIMVPEQKVQYVHRNFPTGSSFGRKAVQYFGEVFKEAGVSPKRLVLMYCNDLFGQNNAKGFQAAHAAANSARSRARPTSVTGIKHTPYEILRRDCDRRV